MSITLISEPIPYAPVNNPCIYTVTAPSALRNEDNFRYIARIFDNNVLLGELKAFKNPDGEWGKFEIGDVIGSAMEAELSQLTIYSPTSFWKYIEVRFGWEYTNSNGQLVRVLNDTNKYNIYWLAGPPYDEWLSIRNLALANLSLHPYIVGEPTAQPLQRRRKVQLTTWSRAWLTWLKNSSGALGFVRINDLVPGESGSGTISIPTNLRNFDIRMVSVRVDAQSVLSATGMSGMTKWNALPLSTNAIVTGVPTEFEIIPCGRWEQFALYWVNDLGAIETMVFNGRSDSTYTSRKENYKQNRPLIGTNGQPQYNTFRHTTRPYSISRQQSWNLWSDWVEDKQLLSTIISSPLVWLHKQDRGILPVVVDTSSFRVEDNGLNRPVNVNFNVTYEEDTI